MYSNEIGNRNKKGGERGRGKGEGKGKRTLTSKDEPEFIPDSLRDKRREEREQKIKQPIARGRQGPLLRPCLCREQLAGEDPRARSPCHRVPENEQARADDHELPCAGVGDGVADGACDGEDEQPCGLPDTADDEWNPAPKLPSKSRQHSEHSEAEEGACERGGDSRGLRRTARRTCTQIAPGR